MIRSARCGSGASCSACRSSRAPPEQGEGWQSAPETGPAVGIHPRGRGPGDTFSLPYFEVDDLERALDSVTALGGTVIHPGKSWAVCKDSEGTPFGLAAPMG